MFGRLTIKALQHDPIVWTANFFMLATALVVGIFLTYTHQWKWLWKEWLTTVDPKRIGVMYFTVVLIMLFKGLVDAAMMRAQQVLAVGDSQGYLTANHFQQIFTAHGTTMIFFVGMGVVFGLMNLVVPLQIGARDVAYPFLNALGFWLFAFAALLVNLSMIVGEFSPAGWLAYPPLSSLRYNPGVGVDYWIWILEIAGVGSLITGINFIVTIFKMRCPGMTLMKMPVFVWSALGTLVLIIFAFPILTATISMLALDRLAGMHFFSSSVGGNIMMYVNLIWAWGHPEVYILVLPAFGVFSEVVSTFSQKRLFGYSSMVWAIIVITFLSFIVWVHHFFTMGAGGSVNAFFGIMTMIIAIPTGVKVFNWLFTQYQGRVRLTTPMLWFLGFVIQFTVGGMAGVLMSIPPADFQVHNSLFLIAHFHSVIIGGVLFGFFAGYAYWFPKIFGFQLNERIGVYAFWLWFVGFLLAFMPLYLLGFMGATRRLNHYDAATGWQPLFIVAAVGVALIILGAFCQVWQLIVSIRQKEEHRDTTGDIWNGHTLEWSTPSPPPIYNFAIIPVVNGRDPFLAMKQGKGPVQPTEYEAIHIPKNTPMGIFIAASSALFGFALIWHIFWLASIGLFGIFAFMIARLAETDTEDHLTGEEVARIEAKIRGHV